MSHTAHIPSHRKPRRSASKLAVRAGVAGGVLSTLAMAGTASASPAAEPVTETMEMPVLDMDLASEVSTAVATAAENTQAAAVDGELNAQEESARTGAAAEAKKAKEAAEKKAKEEADRKAEAERATRNAERTALKSASAAASTDGQGVGTVTAPKGSAAAIISFARAQVGKAYVMGATGPSAFDCSGLVQAAYRQANVSLPRTSQAQSSYGTSVSLSALQPGDILYWGSKGSAYHVALYVGGGKFVGAQNPSTGIVERSLSYDRPTGAVRVL
ncbi:MULTISPECIES: C40 family peptidase [Streptomyces]|uniref:C40 family peptidase n=1 Tax=Streptomyces TaxID=1883 RepID=UPI0016744390|nr:MULTISPECIES: C40 family peptidase [Streptomyces]MBD3577280.1 C40 family peptidase [Streptomyces sp. KD18]GGS85980.1 glycoside hydrolase [Streptomyces toxytricini]